MQIQVRIDDREIQRSLQRIGPAMGGVLAQSLNRTAFELLDAERAGVEQSFEFAGASTRAFMAGRGSFRFDAARPTKLEVRLYPREKTESLLIEHVAGATIGPDKRRLLVGERFAIPVEVRRGARGKVPASRYTLEIDAGLAFGTAHHATTRGCLMALDRVSKREHPRRVLDIGTGTGILAIAAAKALGGPVIASDMDPVAVGVAAGNVRINGVRSRVRVVAAKGLAHPALRGAKADLLFANILLRPLLSLAPSFAGAIRPGGICLLSGILDSQAPTVEARFRNFGFRLESRILLDGWTVLLLRRGSTKPVRAD